MNYSRWVKNLKWGASGSSTFVFFRSRQLVSWLIISIKIVFISCVHMNKGGITPTESLWSPIIVLLVFEMFWSQKNVGKWKGARSDQGVLGQITFVPALIYKAVIYPRGVYHGFHWLLLAYLIDSVYKPGSQIFWIWLKWLVARLTTVLCTTPSIRAVHLILYLATISTLRSKKWSANLS